MVAAFRFVPDRPAMIRIVTEDSDRYVRETAQGVLRGARAAVRVKSGAVRSRITMRQMRLNTAGVTYRVKAEHKRSMLEHEGAQEHDIRPRPRRRRRNGVMVFYWARVGQVVYRTYVRHPGTRGSKFLTRPLVLVAGSRGFRIDTNPVG